MRADVVELLACPHCGTDLGIADATLLCGRGHSFDLSRQGFVTLVAGAALKFSGDTSEMLSARAEFLDAGHFDGILDAVAARVDPGARVLDIGAGTGHYLRRAIAGDDRAVGIGLDVAKAAARRVARLSPSIGAVVADAWRPLPIQSAALTHALSVFAPRNAAEVQRVLAVDGVYVVVTPTTRHLRELIAPLGMVGVDENKPRRLGEALAGRFERTEHETIEFAMDLDARAVHAVVGMGPSAFHHSPTQLATAVAALPDVVTVTASVTVSSYRVLPASAVS